MFQILINFYIKIKIVLGNDGDLMQISASIVMVHFGECCCVGKTAITTPLFMNFRSDGLGLPNFKIKSIA